MSVSQYFGEQARPVLLGNVEVMHYHRTNESYARALRAAGFTIDDLREVPGRSASVPLYLDLRAVLPTLMKRHSASGSLMRLPA